MTVAIIITVCLLLLIAYVFDITSGITKIPSVILLLLSGWLVKQASVMFNIHIPNLTALLPILGTIGLILIVLEGSLELELNKSKISLIKKSAIVALIPMLLLAFLMAGMFQYIEGYSFKNSLISAIPLCVISSAIAIPSVKNLDSKNKEFVIYESSLSDILGVLFFNFVALNEQFNVESFGTFLVQLILIAVVSFVATIGLSLILSKSGHQIKFTPIILLVILIYEISKVYHLPSLVFILLFGLFLGNLEKLNQFKWIKRLDPISLSKEVDKFKEFVLEIAFLIRALFFLLFGYLIETSEIFNLETFVWACAIVFTVFSIRAIVLKLSKIPVEPLVFIAPRGLITILLFFAISPWQKIGLVNRSLIIQVIILTALVMMTGIMLAKKQTIKLDEKV